MVAPAWRRRGAAAALLAAAEAAVELWDERQALLHVYQDNIAAVQASHCGWCASGERLARVLPTFAGRRTLPCLFLLIAQWTNTPLPLPPTPHAPLQLYQKQGYEVVLQEKKGLAAMGRRPRFLMRKRW